MWDGNQKLYEIRVPGDNSLSSAALEADTATGPFYGRMRYLTTVGGTSPLALDRDGLVVMPHMNWRGLYDAGTDTLGQSCCSTIDWVGKDQAAYLHGALVRNPTGWGGSLITGQQDQSGLMYRLNRYYDPTNGRFTQTDPIGIAGGINQYGYAGADPMNFGDPSGLMMSDSHGICTIMAASCGDAFAPGTSIIGGLSGSGAKPCPDNPKIDPSAPAGFAEVGGLAAFGVGAGAAMGVLKADGQVQGYQTVSVLFGYAQGGGVSAGAGPAGSVGGLSVSMCAGGAVYAGCANFSQNGKMNVSGTGAPVGGLKLGVYAAISYTSLGSSCTTNTTDWSNFMAGFWQAYNNLTQPHP